MNRFESQKLPASCLILAGGQGKRLSPDKPLLEIEGVPIIQRTVDVVSSLFPEVIVVTNTPEKYQFLDLPLVPDERVGCGPLMGIYSGMRKVTYPAAFVCAADMPFLDEELIRAQYRELDGFDIVAPCPSRKPEFLHAFYRKQCLPVMRETLENDIFKVGALTKRCKTLRLDEYWFQRHGFTRRMEMAFTNINTIQDYCRWQVRSQDRRGRRLADDWLSSKGTPNPDALKVVDPGVLDVIRRTLIEQETDFQQMSEGESISSLWAHSSMVGRIAHYIAKEEGWEPEPALLAGLLHDTGKFVDGRYHEDDVPEEKTAVRFVQRILSGTEHEKWIPLVSQAVLSMYLDDEATSDIGRAVYDADNINKLGCMGVAQFFAKNALRRRFLDDGLLARASIELTYAHHATETLKTATGRALARERTIRTRRFFMELVDEWTQLGLGAFDILEEDIGGVVCILVVPIACYCGGRLEISSDILDAFKCRSVVVSYSCLDCGGQNEYSFCLPNVKGLPRMRQYG
jgi:molybdopterin-guanine dinucleotide biosynthesis protein A/HD superfamily phosphodiesterase